MADGDWSEEFLPLRGRAETALEGGNRFLVPKEMRERLGRDFVLWVAEMGCVVAQPAHIWKTVEREIAAGDPFNRGCDRLRRLIYETSTDGVNCDEQGRLFLEKYLRIPARLADGEGKKLVEKVLVIGAYDRVEIWSPEEHRRFEADPEGYNAGRWAKFESARGAMKSSPPRTHPIEGPTPSDAVEDAIRRMGSG